MARHFNLSDAVLNTEVHGLLTECNAWRFCVITIGCNHESIQGYYNNVSASSQSGATITVSKATATISLVIEQ